MISRRDLLKTAAMGTAAAATGCMRMGDLLSRQKSYKLRTITYNVLVCKGWAAEKGGPKAPRERMPRLFADALGKFEPDIITFQESPGEAVVAEIAGLLGMNNTFFHSGDSWPGAVITRFEILESKNCPIVGGKRPEDLFTRHWGRAVLQAPFGRLILHSAHLHPAPHPNEVRRREVAEVIKAMRPDLESDDAFIFQGDLNHQPDGPEDAAWKKAGFVDTFDAAGIGIVNTIKADKPSARIDYVWAYGELARHIRECRVLFEHPFRTEPDDPKSMALSDHLPVLATFG